MKRSSSSESESSASSAKKRWLSEMMFKILQQIKPIDEVIEISDDDERELSPADSGFKEPSTSTSSSNKLIEIDSKTPQNFNTHHLSQNRGSHKIKILQKEEEKLTKTEKILLTTLQCQNFVHPLESISTAMSRYNPKVQCRILSKYEITKRLQLGKIIPKVQEFPNEIEFQGLILHQWRNYDGEHPHYFVKWIPMNILDDEWIIACHAKATKLKKKIKLSELNTRQRGVVCEMVFKGIKF